MCYDAIRHPILPQQLKLSSLQSESSQNPKIIKIEPKRFTSPGGYSSPPGHSTKTHKIWCSMICRLAVQGFTARRFLAGTRKHSIIACVTWRFKESSLGNFWNFSRNMKFREFNSSYTPIAHAFHTD